MLCLLLLNNCLVSIYVNGLAILERKVFWERNCNMRFCGMSIDLVCYICEYVLCVCDIITTLLVGFLPLTMISFTDIYRYTHVARRAVRFKWKSMSKPVQNLAISHVQSSFSVYTFKKWNFVFYKSIKAQILDAGLQSNKASFEYIAYIVAEQLKSIYGKLIKIRLYWEKKRDTKSQVCWKYLSVYWIVVLISLLRIYIEHVEDS